MTTPQTPSSPRITRLAPSPTGALHLGNARTFLINWALARQQSWKIVLRIEDLDGPRLKPGADLQAIEDLRWLGLDWDDGPFYQRHDLAPYTAALAELQRAGLIYPCTCTRRDISQAQSAPHQEDHELRYPGTCRPKGLSSVQCLVSSVEESTHAPRPLPDTGRKTLDTGQLSFQDTGQASASRVIVPDQPIDFLDEIHGPQSVNVQAQIGDFVVATKSGLPAYQLAVVVDDARQGITEVVRGDDLLASTARQLWLYRRLKLVGAPRYWHLPLVLGPDGRRLAKRHGDTRLAWYRENAVPPQRIIGLMAAWCGLIAEPTPMTTQEFLTCFDLSRLPRTPVTFTPQDHAWFINR